MYKSISIAGKEEIIILDPKWENQIDLLRWMDKNDQLICQGCKQPVRVKAGIKRIRQWHFAHKHLLGCSYGKESPQILLARAALYKLLQSKFRDQVTIEKKLDFSRLPRPIDCWVSHKGKIFAYWIIDSGIRYQSRLDIKNELIKHNAQPNWVFVSEMLNRDPITEDTLWLSPTERDFLLHSEYVEILFKDFHLKDWGEKSIHYLDAKNELITTYRSLSLLHSPNVFSGNSTSHSLSDIKISPKTGEFVHPGEYEFLQESRRQRKKYDLEKNQEEERMRNMRKLINISDNKLLKKKEAEENNEYNYPRMEDAECIYCGQITTNWWHIFTKDGKRMCKCKDCRDKSFSSRVNGP